MFLICVACINKESMERGKHNNLSSKTLSTYCRLSIALKILCTKKICSLSFLNFWMLFYVCHLKHMDAYNSIQFRNNCIGNLGH